MEDDSDIEPRRIGKLVLEQGELDFISSVQMLRSRIEVECSDKLDFRWKFLRNYFGVTMEQEFKKPPLYVMTRGKSKVKLSHLKSPRPRANAASCKDTLFTVTIMKMKEEPIKEVSLMEELEHQSRYQGYMEKLDIFAGKFQLFYFRVDTATCSLDCFGPYDSIVPKVPNLARKLASDSLNLNSVWQVKPYEGTIPGPECYYTMELHCDDGAKWTLAIPSIAEFTKWIKYFHKVTPNLAGVNYRIKPKKCEWTICEVDDKQFNSREAVRSFESVVFHTGRLGIQIGEGATGTEVKHVAPGSQAEILGIKLGDILVTVDGIDVTGMGWKEIVPLLEARPLQATFGRPCTMVQLKSGNRFYIQKLKTMFTRSPNRMNTETNSMKHSGHKENIKNTPPIAPPRNLTPPPGLPNPFKVKGLSRGFGAAKQLDSMPISVESNYITQETRAASRQLSRYRNQTIRFNQTLSSAFQESYQQEEQFESLLASMLEEAKTRIKHEANLGSNRELSSRSADTLESSNTKKYMAFSSRLAFSKIGQKVKVKNILNKANLRFAGAIKPGKYASKIKNALEAKFKRRRHNIAALISLLRSTNIEEKEEALDAILDLVAKDDMAIGVLATHLDLLIECLNNKENIELKENVAGILWNMSDDVAIAQKIIKSGAMDSLLYLIAAAANDEESSDIAKEEAAGALWNLSDLPQGKIEILKHEEGLRAMLELIMPSNHCTDFTKENVAGIIWNLSGNPDCLDSIFGFEEGPVEALAYLIVKGTSVAQENAAGALMNISLSVDYRSKIPSCPSAISALVQLLVFGSLLSREHACGTLHHVAINDAGIQRLIVQEGAIPPLVRLLKQTDSVNARSRAALCLRTLSEDIENKKEITESDCISSLVEALEEKNSMLEIHLVEALWVLAHENQDNRILISEGAIPKLVEILKNGNDAAKARAAGVIGVLADDPRNTRTIVLSGALDPLVSMVKSGDHESRREAANALGRISMGDPQTQSRLMRSLKFGQVIGVSRGDIYSIRAKLEVLGVDDDDEYFDSDISDWASVGAQTSNSII